VSLKTFFEASTVAGVATSVDAIRWVAETLRPDVTSEQEQAGMILEEGVL
jgi:hypothetical protein